MLDVWKFGARFCWSAFFCASVAASGPNDRPGTTTGAEVPDSTPAQLSVLDYLQRRLANSSPLLDLPQAPADIPAWREKVAIRLPEILGMNLSIPAPLEPKTKSVRERDGYCLEHISFTSEAGVVVPAYVLIPNGVSRDRPAPAVLCLQGVVPGGKDELAGEVEHNLAAAKGLKGYKDDFARQLVRAGFVTLAIDMRFDGERAQRSPSDPFGLNDRTAAMLLAHKYATMTGQSFYGLNLVDARRALDYLETRPDVQREAIGCAGFSFGSTLGAWLAAIDRRIKVVALEGTWPSLRRLALRSLEPAQERAEEKPWHWMMAASYQIVPGFLREMDLNLTVAAVVPTPMLLSYESDIRRIYANHAEAEDDIAPVRRAYEAFHASDALRVVHVEGGHYWREEVIVPWLTDRLHTISSSKRSTAK